MATILVDFLLEDLEKVLSCSTDFILAEKDEIQSVSEELKFIRAFLHDAQDKFIDHHELKDLVARIRQVSCEALALFDFSTLVAIEKKKSAKARKILHDCSPDLKIYLKERISWARILKQFSPGTMTHVQDVAGNLFYDVQSIDVSDLTENNESTSAQIVHVFDHSQKLAKFAEKVLSIKKAMIEIGIKELYGIGLPDIEVLSFSEASTSRECSNCLDDEDIMVGLDDEALKIKERLVGDQKQLEIISLVGMAGIGKTTLARKVYNDPLIVYRFHIRGWTYVSQVYQKHDLLLRILSCIVENEDDPNSFDKERLGEELHRRLKGRKYLIVVDDIWNIEVWEDLRKCFPNDSNGSRIMLTTRIKDVALHINPQSPPHCLSFLSQDESWDLLQRKVFRKGNSCSPELMEVGKQIAVKCRGLPLAIVVVGGLLSKNEKKQNWWEEVAKHMSSYMTGDAEEFMDVLELSYTHLPQHLKSCFQYFGAFPEDYEIPVWRLALLWIAEGFVEQTGEKSLELLAEDYLADLIDRSLVIVSERRSRGGVKVCHIHDILRDLCLRKAKEKNNLQQIDWYGRVASPSTPIFHDILCFHSHGFHSISGKTCSPNVISLFSYAPSFQRTHHPGRSMSCIYIVLRVLNLWSVYLNNFPEEILQLFHLRYLELHVRYLDSLPQQISNLWNLETLVIDIGEWGPVSIPHSVWNMVKLRHIRISDEIKFQKPCANHGYPSVLNSLQSLSALPLSRPSEDTEFVLARTPNLRKIAFYRGPNELETFSLPNLSYLSHVDTLKLVDNSVWGASQLRIPQPSSFPPNVKKLTLSGGHGDWKEISKLGKLPNLEVLKLRRNFFSGPSWKTSDGEFLQLKYLKLSSMDLQKWITSAGHFPNLQQLVLHGCMVLEEIPSCLGDIPTLQIIEISWSSQSASNSVFRIQEEQRDNGNDGLKVSVYHPNEDDENNASEDVSEVCTLQ